MKKNKCSAFAYTFLIVYDIIFIIFKWYHFYKVLSGIAAHLKTVLGDLYWQDDKSSRELLMGHHGGKNILWSLDYTRNTSRPATSPRPLTLL